jgi:NADP-dependent 3-hydroxy acid dehydrogenase YdfG
VTTQSNNLKKYNKMKNQVVLITGASSGIGKETARLLSQRGYKVYGAARRTDKMKELEQFGVKLLEMDVTDDESMTAGITSIIKNEGRIDVLVNNAGYGSYGALEDVPISEAKYAPTAQRTYHQYIIYRRSYWRTTWCLVSCYQVCG